MPRSAKVDPVRDTNERYPIANGMLSKGASVSTSMLRAVANRKVPHGLALA